MIEPEQEPLPIESSVPEGEWVSQEEGWADDSSIPDPEIPDDDF